MQKSNLREELKLEYLPVSVILTDEEPENAVEYDPAKLGGPCTLSAVREAARGNAVYFCESSKGCPGSKPGLGFSDDTKIPGGIEYFLSCGRGEGYPEGEKLKKTPEAAKTYYDNLPKKVMNSKYILFKPVDQTDSDNAKLVIFLATPDQLSALITLFSYESGSTENVIMPMTSGCSSLVKLPLAELKKDNPRAVVGLVDIWARPLFESNIFALTVPFKSYLEMESNSKDCFLQAKTWDGVKKRL
ncbi:MAG: DUF169 domain-containing protein [Clostridia bacterium]|nr:DUF169 domain-containing protein [Clostridia bacterium]